MSLDVFTWLGFAAGAITSIGFLPQLAKGFRTKSLYDVSSWMPLVLAAGMSLWLAYGIFRNDIAIIAANAFGMGCNILLLLLKKWYA
jgi:MtN3 and saliva related transmembrane protein